MEKSEISDDIYDGFVQHPMEKLYYEMESQDNFEPNFGPMTADLYSVRK